MNASTRGPGSESRDQKRMLLSIFGIWLMPTSRGSQRIVLVVVQGLL